MTFAAHINAALDAAHAFATAVAEARKCPEVKDKDADGVREALLPIVAKYYGVALVDGQRKAAGRKVLDKDAASYEAANKALQRLTKAIIGEGSDKAEELTVPRHIAALAAQLAAACNEYEQARKLGATALANAFAK